MALSDAVNVRVGVVRRQKQAQRLAAQMAGKGRGVRVQGAGRAFRNSSDLLAAVAPRFALASPVAPYQVRPRGFDPDPPVVLTQGGGISGGGAPVAASRPSADSLSAVGTPLPPSGTGDPFMGGSPGGVLSSDPEHNAFVTGASDVDPFAVGQANVGTGLPYRPNVWNLWMAAKIRQLQALG